MAEKDGTVTADVYKLGERTLAGLRQCMLDVGDAAGVDVGAGLGSDAIWLWYEGEDGKREYAYVRGRDLLAAWIERKPSGDERARKVLEALA